MWPLLKIILYLVNLTLQPTLNPRFLLFVSEFLSKADQWALIGFLAIECW